MTKKEFEHKLRSFVEHTNECLPEDVEKKLSCGELTSARLFSDDLVKVTYWVSFEEWSFGKVSLRKMTEWGILQPQVSWFLHITSPRKNPSLTLFIQTQFTFQEYA